MTTPVNRSRTARAAASVLACCAVAVPAVLGGLPASAAPATSAVGTVDATGNLFTFRANPASRSPHDLGDSVFDARLSRGADGSYVFSIDPPNNRYTGSCAVPPPENGIPGQVYLCTTPSTPTIDLVGNPQGIDYTSLLVHPRPGEAAFTVAATIRTGGGADIIDTAGLVAKINAGRGDDRIDAEVVVDGVAPLSTPGGDVRGGRGTDTVSYEDAAGVTLRVSLDGRADDGRPGERDNVHSDVEDLVAPPTGFTAIGSAGPNVLTGGRTGPDHLVGRGGRDTLVGGGGDDRLDARDGRGGDRVACGGGTDRVWLDEGDTLVRPRACERVTYAR